MTAPQARSAVPRVCIGMPVYNEERFVEESLRALLAQDYPQLQIVISDNASTDRTGAICEAVAAGDDRVRYVRQRENLGALGNARWTLEHCDGDYFMWAGGHDLWSPELVRLCVDELEAVPDAAIAVPSSCWVDAGGQPLARHYGYTDTRGMHPVARFFTVLWGNMHPVLGVIRARYLREVRILPVVGTDLLLLEELALRGDFVHVPGALWTRREPRGPETHGERMQRYTSHEHGVSRGHLDRLFPLLRLPLELVRIAWRCERPLPERLAMILAVAGSLPVRYLAGRG